MVKPGGRIGSYLIQEELGRGGMGIVFRARDERLDRDVAIKTLPEALAEDPNRLDLFRREARTVAQLSHPHIAQIHHLLEQDGQTYLVLELVRGRSLAQIIEHRRLDEEACLRLGAQIAAALEAAHAKGVVHRDLKPGNVMVAEDGTARVLDFGLAVTRTTASPWIGDETIGPGGSMGDKVVGTPGYMAPEQARGEAIDHRADLFSFGCLLYELLARRPAFEGKNHAARLTSTLTTEPDLRSVTGPPAVISMLEACLVKAPHRRLSSAAEARRILEAALEPEPSRNPTPPATVKRHPTNLRSAVDRFIGRADDLRELGEILEHTRLVTLTGAGGCGKTRLASELGERALAQFTGGAWMVELAPLSSPDLLVVTVASVLKVNEQPLKESIATRLAQFPALLILDNCEHVLDEVSAFVHWLVDSVQDVHVLATSREPLGVGGERVWRIRNLSLPAASEIRTPGGRSGGSSGFGSGSRAGSGSGSGSGSRLDLEKLLTSESVALFIDRARQVKPDFELTAHNAPAVASICSRLDGIPLAIELAAARVKVLPPEQLDEKLNDRFRLLRAGRGRTERHQTLRAALDWSYQLLHEDERRALRALSVFLGGCTLEAATYVIAGPGGDDFETLDLLANLVDKSLLIVEERKGVARYRLLESVRIFALEELAAAGEAQAAQVRHLEFFHDLARRFDALGATVGLGEIERLEQDHENLLEAIRCAAGDQRQVRQSLAMCNALRTFWHIQAQMVAAALACQTAYEAPGAANFPEELGLVCWLLGQQLTIVGDYAEARARAEQALQIGVEHDLPLVELVAAGLLSTLASYEGDADRALDLNERSLKLARRLGDRPREAQCVFRSGAILLYRGEFAPAASCFEESRRLFEAIGHFKVADAAMWEAMAACRGGDQDRAARRLHEAFLVSRERGVMGAQIDLVLLGAELAEAFADPERYARWMGCFDVVAGRRSYRHDPVEQKAQDCLVERARQAMGEPAYRAAYQQGEALQLDAALDEVQAWISTRVSGRQAAKDDPARPVTPAPIP